MLWKEYKQASQYSDPTLPTVKQALWGLSKLEATSGAQFLIAAEMLTAQVVSLHAGELRLVNSEGGTASGAAERAATCPCFSREPPVWGIIGPGFLC